MKNLFDKETYFDIVNRLNKLTPNVQPIWGKMNVAQMFAHCREAFKVPLSNEKMPRMFMGYLLGWILKPKLYNDKPWGKNLPTAPNFKITDQRDFETEKLKLLESVAKFYSSGPTLVGRFPHPFFGTLNGEQWGKSMYKHLDHHLQQFGV